MKTVQKRNKKWNPEKRFAGMSREDYILLPWKRKAPPDAKETEELVETPVDETA